MIGEFIIRKNGKNFHYTNIDDIPETFDHLIKFLPKTPPDPHTQAEHDYIKTFNDKFKEIFKRGND